MTRAAAFTVSLVLIVMQAQIAMADEYELAQSITREGTIVMLAGALALPLLKDGEGGESQSLRIADAIASSALAAYAIKGLTRVERLDGTGYDAFPSNHAATAFAAATIAAEYEPENVVWWYGGATLISWSRVRTNRHRVSEVVAGAALGYGIAQLELDLPEGMLIAPFVSPTGDGMGVELQVSF